MYSKSNILLIMGKPQQIAVTLEPLLREYLEYKVANGDYKSLSAAMNAAVRGLLAEDKEAGALAAWYKIAHDLKKRSKK